MENEVRGSNAFHYLQGGLIEAACKVFGLFSLIIPITKSRISVAVRGAVRTRGAAVRRRVASR